MKTELIIKQHIKYDETVILEFPNAQVAAIVMDKLLNGVPANSNTSFIIKTYEAKEKE